MRPNEIKDCIDQMGLSEKLMLVEDIWDSIAASNSDIPLARWQEKALDKRYAEFKQGEHSLHDWKEVHEELRNKYK